MSTEIFETSFDLCQLDSSIRSHYNKEKRKERIMRGTSGERFRIRRRGASSRASAVAAGAAIIAALSVASAFVPPSSSRRTVDVSGPPTRNHGGVVAGPLGLLPAGGGRAAAPSSRGRRVGTTSLRAEQDFDSTQYTDAAWGAIAALPQCATSYSATSVDAPMLLSCLLNPTKYGAGEAAQTAKQVASKLLEDSGADVERLRREVEEWLDKQPKVSGDTSAQKVRGKVEG